MNSAVAAAGLRVLAITEDLLLGEELGALADLSVLHGLAHINIRDAFIAQLLGHPAAAQALVRDLPVSMTWLHQAPSPEVLQAAQVLIDRLAPIADREVSTRDAICSIRALLLWLTGRPLEAQFTIATVSHDYSLAGAIVTMIASGYEPQPYLSGGQS